jgi:hypothetical protein
MPSVDRQPRRRVGIPKSKIQTTVAAPDANQGFPGRFGWTSVALVAAVVEMVRVAVPAAVPVMFTGVVEPKLSVGGYWAPGGLEVTEAVNATLPVKPSAGVTVIVDVFPLVAPETTLTAVPLSVKPGVVALVTVTNVGVLVT